jgi:hypothetical protein
MQQTRKTSFIKTLLGGKRRATLEPKKAVQPLEPLEPRQLAQVSGGESLPRGGWQ